MGRAKRHFDVTSVDPSEYEPQVVELSEQLIQDSSPSEKEESPAQERSQKDDHPERKEKESDDTPTLTDGVRKDNTLATATASKNARWLSKLQKLRQQFTAPPTD